MLTTIVLLFVLIFYILLIATVMAHLVFLIPYVPTKQKVVLKMIKAANLKPRQTVFDLGCGDGRLLIEAEKSAKGVKAVGFEIAPVVYLLAMIRKLIAHSKAKIRFQNLFKANLRRANIIFCYLLPNVMPRLAEKIKKECRPGTQIISNTFHIPGLKLHRVLEKNPLQGTPTIYVYRI